MALYRRPNSPNWHYDFTVQGRRLRGSTETPDDFTAQAVEAKLRADAILGGLTGKKPSLTLDQAFGKYLIEHAAHLPVRSRKTIEGQLDTLLKGLGRDTRIDADLGGKLSDYIARRRGDRIRRRGRAVRTNPGRLVSPSTINHEVALLRTVLRMARDRWRVGVEMPDWKAYRLAQRDGRTRWLREDEARRVMAELAPHIRPIVTFALLTGQRLKQVMALDWSQIDLRGRLITFRVKSRKHLGGRLITLRIGEALLVLLANQGPREAGPVWLRNGKPIRDIKWGYNRAVKRAGVTDFTFHDLRHTAATWLRQNKVRLEGVKEQLGHADIRSTQRYSHIGEDEIAAVADTLGDTVTAHLRHSAADESQKPLRPKAKRSA